MAGKIWADPCRSHDPLVLNWVAAALEFDKLITCFGAPVDKMVNAIGEQAVVCRERMDLQQAKNTWESFWQGQTTLKEIFLAHGNKVCMMAPERMDCLPTLVAKLQRDLMELHTTTIFDKSGSSTSRDWKFGLLINVPKFPVCSDGKTEDIALGLNFVKNEWLEMPLWPFIDKIVFLKQLKDLQLSAGWNTQHAVKVTRYFGVIIMSGENQAAIQMVRNAHGQVWLSNNDNPHKIKWGTLRMDLHHLESHKMKQKNYFKPLIKVWRYMHVPFPTCQMHGRSDDSTLEMTIGHRFMLDFILEDVNIKDLDTEMKAKSYELKHHYHDKLVVVPASRRSNGHQGQFLRMQAWDLHCICEDCEEAGRMVWDFKNKMIHRSPIVGWSKQFHLFEVHCYYLLEVSNMRAIRELQLQGKIAWTFIINGTMAIVSTPEERVSLKKSEEFRDNLIAFNQRQNKIKVHEGGTYVERIVLSKAFFQFDEFKPYFTQHDRVFWEKFHEREEQASDSWAQGSAVAGNEVMVHCQNFPKDKDVIQGLLEKKVTPYLVKVMMEQHHINMEPASLKWIMESNVFSWKVVVESSDVANILCTKVVNLEVRMPDGNGCITFKSGFHMMAKQDLRQYFSQLMITDLPRESFATTTSASSSGPSTTSAPSSGVPSAPQAAPSTASSDWHDVTEDPSMAPYLG